MLIAEILLPTMLFVICKSQGAPQSNINALTAEKAPDLYSYTGPSATEGNGNDDQLTDNYRQFVAKSLMNLHDSCKLYDFLQSIKVNYDGE